MQYRKLKSLKFLYEINENGELRNVKSKKIIKGYVEKNGYVRVKIENKCLGVIRTTIHQLVAEAFIPNIDNKSQVNHINGIKTDNRVENLEWCTPSENMIHATKHNLNKIEELKKHSIETRKKVIRKENNMIFESITSAGEWCFENNLCKNKKSGIAGISAVLRKKRKNFAKSEWRFI